MAIGAVVGGAVGYFTSSAGKEDGRRYSDSQSRYYRASEEAQARQAAEAENRSVTNRNRTLAYNNAETVRRNPQAASTAIQRFIRRPQFQSSTGLVQEVENRTRRQFQPRY